MVVNPPDPPDIQTVTEHVPDWLWQNLVSDFIHDGFWAAAALALLAWKHRKRITQTFRGPRHIERTVSDTIGITDNVQPVLLSGIAHGRSSVSGALTVGNPSPAKWLTDEGLELLSWYLRQR